MVICSNSAASMPSLNQHLISHSLAREQVQLWWAITEPSHNKETRYFLVWTPKIWIRTPHDVSQFGAVHHTLFCEVNSRWVVKYKAMSSNSSTAKLIVCNYCFFVDQLVALQWKSRPLGMYLVIFFLELLLGRPFCLFEIVTPNQAWKNTSRAPNVSESHSAVWLTI